MFLNEERAAAIMDEQGIDAFLATTLENLFYFSGLWSENFIVTPRIAQGYALSARENLNSPTVITGIGDAAAFLKSCTPTAKVILYGSFFRYEKPGAILTDLEQGVKDLVIKGEPKKNSLAGIAAAVKDAGLERATIGIDERGVSRDFIEALGNELPNTIFVFADKLMRHIRAVKTSEEVEQLKSALRLTEAGIQAAMSVARVGVTEEEMIRALESSVSAGGGRPLFTFIYFGPRGALGQLPQGEGVLKKGEVIRFDTGCVFNGYNSDIARNFSLGQPDERALRLYNAMLAGEEAAFQAMRPGVKASEVFHQAVQAVRDAGVPAYQRHHVGHGVGLEVYDVPLLGPNDHTILEAGMTFEVETPFYEMGLAGLQPEDTVVLREDGPELLTTLSRSFEIIDL